VSSPAKPPELGKLFFLSFSICAAGLGASIACGDSPAGWWPLPLFVAGALAAYLVWKGVRWADDWTKYLSFGAVVLLACIANRVLYSADLWVSGDRIAEWPFYARYPENAVRKAEMATILGTLLTVFAWLISGGARQAPGSIVHAPRAVVIRVLTMTYALSLIGILLTKALPDLVRDAGQLVPTMLGLGLAASFYVPFLLGRERAWGLAAVTGMTIPFVYVALGTGMKENLIIALLPVGYMLWTYSQRTSVRLALAAASLLALALITSYVGYFREEVWQSQRSVSPGQVLNEFLEGASSDGGIATITSGIEGFIRRNNGPAYRGWAVSHADEYRYEPGLVFSPMLYVFIPRLLWPNKPAIRQGWEYSGLLYGVAYTFSSDSSSSAGFFAGLYLGQGWPAVIAGAISIGLLMAVLSKLAFRLGGPTLLGLFTFCMLPYAVRLDETWTVYAFSWPIIGFVYIYILVRAAGALTFLLGAPPSGTTASYHKKGTVRSGV
jgi:hypothetical protein